MKILLHFVAAIEFGTRDYKQTNSSDEISADEGLNDQVNINVIAREPISETQNEYTCYKIEKEKDHNIQWIKNLILENGDTKPQITRFNNEKQRLLHKEYDNLRVIENLVYRTAEDKDGYMRNLFVLPEQVTDQSIKQFHSSIYNGHLGRQN